MSTPDPLSAALDEEALVTVVCDTLWDNGVYMQDSVPVAREVVRRLRTALATDTAPLDVESGFCGSCRKPGHFAGDRKHCCGTEARP